LPECNHIYPKIYTTANSHFFTISEIIRKECLLCLGDELPSIIKVSIESFQKMNVGDWKIRAIIHVDNLGQKKIIIGHKGKNIKKISMLSRYNIRRKFNKKIHLFLWIKINI
jgi:GTP-binding protein Era